MTMELQGRGGWQSFTLSQWSDILIRANKHGWEPLGTRIAKSKDPKWEGGYCSNEGQLVVAVDARALAAALERSLKCKCKIPKSLNPGRIKDMVRFSSRGNFRIY
jgi:hypothetical protein